MSEVIAEILKKPYHRCFILDSDGRYFAQIFEFTGCFAIGETRDEALANLEDVAESWLLSVFALGQSVPEPLETLPTKWRDS